MTAAKLPAGIYRAKGVVAASEAPERRAVLQVVGKRVDVSFDGDWGGQAPRTRIVAIGAAGTIGPGDLENALRRLPRLRRAPALASRPFGGLAPDRRGLPRVYERPEPRNGQLIACRADRFDPGRLEADDGALPDA